MQNEQTLNCVLHYQLLKEQAGFVLSASLYTLLWLSSEAQFTRDKKIYSLFCTCIIFLI